MREQFDMLRRGLHIAVATPGRLKDLLGKRKMNLDTCLYLCLDEADRMVDSTGFEEEVREVRHGCATIFVPRTCYMSTPYTSLRIACMKLSRDKPIERTRPIGVASTLGMLADPETDADAVA